MSKPQNVLYIVDDQNLLLGSLTDGDLRRALLADHSLDESVTVAMNTEYTAVAEDQLNQQFITFCRQKNIRTFPVINDRNEVKKIVQTDSYREIIPVHAVIMAGGKGERLKPLTLDTPKPMLIIGDKPIIEHNIDRLCRYGIKHLEISVSYLKEKIIDHFGTGESKDLNIRYIHEDNPLGTAGALGLVEDFKEDVILLMNSDLLTNIDFGDFYKTFLESEADMAVATIPHVVDLPYAIMELEQHKVISLKEKPRYTYFANAGIYLMKREIAEKIERETHLNATTLMENVIKENLHLINYPIIGYWLDIGKMNDYLKGQEDIKHINL